MVEFASRRRWMVEHHLVPRGISERRIIDAMLAVPREAFLPHGLQDFAYADTALPLYARGQGHVVPSPYQVALFMEAASIALGDRVLDIATGSGYVAAVACRLAGSVYGVVRQPTTGQDMRRRLEQLGYANVHLKFADPLLGWPEMAPFDVILLPDDGPEVPQSLLDQLAIGGRLVAPLERNERSPLLKRLVRVAEDQFVEEVVEGHSPFAPMSSHAVKLVPRPRSDADILYEHAIDLPEIGSHAFGGLFDQLGKAKVVCIGEASHGTSEFYTARAAITRHLIEHHNFRIVALEGDWPDIARFDAYVKSRPSPREQASRFPSWMWRNEEMRAFLDWLKGWNAARPGDDQTDLRGLDLYSLHGSIEAVLEFLDRTDPQAAQVARQRYGCLTPWQKDPASYGRAALSQGYAPCEKPVLDMLRHMLQTRLDEIANGDDGEALFDAKQNARLVASAESYYRSIYYGSVASWNLRDTHMFETLKQVLNARGAGAKVVVWAHNSHLGDASQTEMGRMGEINLGQLCRAHFGAQARLVGFGTDRGSVAAASEWGGPMEVKAVRPSLPDSVENLVKSAGRPRCLLDLGEDAPRPVRELLGVERLERAIGVIYRPETERLSHYFLARLARQFDLYLWFEESRAVTPTQIQPGSTDEPDTFPFGV